MSKKKEKMLSIVAHGPQDYRVENVNIPYAGFEEVIIKIEFCGICGSDITAYKGADMYWGGDVPWMKAPVTPGHEFYGVVVEMGEGAEEKHNIQIGDRVTTDQIKPCNNCMYCNRGKYWMCETHNMYGFQREIAEGGMAEYMKIGSTSYIYKIPEEVNNKEASLIEPMACAAHAVQRATIEFEDVVVLAGAGTLGLCMLQLIRLKTPKKIIVLDPNEMRLEIAQNLGADLVFNPEKENISEIIKDVTGGYGSDVYIEASGTPAGVKQGLEIVRKLGRFIEFGVFSQETSTDWSVIGDKKELDIRGSHLGPYMYPVIINLFKRKLLHVEDIITHIYNLKDFSSALETAQSSGSIKVLLKP